MTETDPAGEPLQEKSEVQLTRELEVLISAALVLALFQLPRLLDRWWDNIGYDVTGTAFGITFGAYYVAKLASYGLIGAISIHFLLRGFWVALLGLRSAYPGGVDRTRLHQGTLIRGFIDERLLTLHELQTRIDRIAAVIFAFVFMILTMLFGATLWAVAALIVALTASWTTGRESATEVVFWVALFSFAATQIFLSVADQVSKKRTLPRAVERIGRRIMRATHYLTLSFVYSPIFLTFSTRTSPKMISAVQTVFIFALVGVFMVSTFASVGILGFDSYVWFPPTRSPDLMQNSHYENLRPAGEKALVPTIQSEIVTEPYLQLFIPYVVRRDNALIEKVCPDVPPFRSDGLFMRPRGGTDAARTAAALACFEKIYTVTLDGQRLAPLDAAFYVHPESGIHGRLAMIPAGELAPGRHEILVKRARWKGERERRTPSEYVIPFWR